MTNRDMTAETDLAVSVPAGTPAGHVSASEHAEPDTAAGHAHPAAPAADPEDMSTDPADAVPADMLAEYFIEARAGEGNAAAQTWTTLATGSVRLDKPGAEGLEDFVDDMARTARALLLDSRALRVSAFIRATGDAVYTEVPAVDPTTGARTPRWRREVGRGVDTQRKRRRTRHRGL